ncbi:PTS sugar transporter subunit IIA [Enterococcus sp. LJL120]
MNQYLIATHGSAAKGIKETIKILTGMDKNIFEISAYVADLDLETAIINFFKEISVEDCVVIFTDLNGGSVNQAFIPYLERNNIHIITGFNIPLILEIILEKEPYTNEKLQKKIDMCKEQMVLVTQQQIPIYEEDDFF